MYMSLIHRGNKIKTIIYRIITLIFLNHIKSSKHQGTETLNNKPLWGKKSLRAMDPRCAEEGAHHKAERKETTELKS